MFGRRVQNPKVFAQKQLPRVCRERAKIWKISIRPFNIMQLATTPAAGLSGTQTGTQYSSGYYCTNNTHTHTPRRPFSFLFKYYSTDRKREWRTTGFREILLCATMTTTTTTRVLWTSKKRRYVFARAIASGFTRGQSDLDSRERRSSWFAFCFFKIARTRREIELHDGSERIIRQKKKKKMRL